MNIITTQPIPMIQENAQLCPSKLRIEYRFTDDYVSADDPEVVISIFGIDKTGHNLIAECPLEVADGYTSGEYASSIEIGIPQQEYPFIFLSYTPIAGFKILGDPMLILEAKEYPDIISNDVYTSAVLT